MCSPVAKVLEPLKIEYEGLDYYLTLLTCRSLGNCVTIIIFSHYYYYYHHYSKSVQNSKKNKKLGGWVEQRTGIQFWNILLIIIKICYQYIKGFPAFFENKKALVKVFLNR